ncbi:MAG: DEAD/DEAH box helicase family protein [Gracilimonas sp.]|uniref:DEAD/DEAH box helicase family protein n=1 Tax=Gracilimonas sp. TaxID=1974203 RepID=UPI0037534516|nr:DEAD/DEAH box helicase family protein [Gracilimonas sp.]
MSNFEFLQTDWPEFIDDAQAVERLVHYDPRGACVRARYLVEQVVLWMYENDEDLELPYDTTMANLIHQVEFKGIVKYEVFNKMNAIRKAGNIAAHERKKVTEHDSQRACEEVFHIMYWLWSTYNDGEPRPDLTFDESLLPKVDSAPELTKDQFDQLQKEIEEKTEFIREVQRSLEEKDEKLAQRNREIKQIREQTAKFASTHDYNEAQTREFLIDVLLREAGWEASEKDVREYEVDGMPKSVNPSGKGYVDYVLWDDNGQPLALVEAKRTTRNYEEGQHQGQLYADCLEKEFGVRPIIFLSNGYQIWMWDDTVHPIRPVLGFYTKESLQRLFFQKRNKESLHLAEINHDITGRPYQVEAIRRVGERFEKGHREALLVMATGTGKTRTSISVVDILQRNNWAKRVLFLADRNALVKQAYDSFAEHLPNTPIVNLVKDKNDDAARVVFSTYPTVLNQIEKLEEGQRKFDVGYFDLVIIDEAHRSIYNKYEVIFKYFDALLLGLTATPKSEIDRDTYKTFKTEEGVPTFAYELETAVDEGYLNPPKKISVPSKFLKDGITYDDLSDEEKEEYDDLLADDETGLIPDHIDASQLNDWLFNKHTVEGVLKNLMEDGIKVEGGDRLGKTIIFAKNHKHAVFIQETFDQNYPQYAGNFARVIDNKVDHSQDLIDRFCTTEKDPVIAISVDMMDTGIDAPDVVNLVFFKPVRSRSKFNQMIGRGTRLRENLFGPGKHKSQFLILDYCGNFEFFKQNPEGFEPSPAKSLSSKIFDLKLSLAYKLLNDPYKDNEVLQGYREALLDELHQLVANLPRESVQVRPHLRIVDRLEPRTVWDSLTSGERQEIVNSLGDLIQFGFGDDELSRRFDYLMLTLQHEFLDNALDDSFNKGRVIRLADHLFSKRHIPAISEKKETLKFAMSENFWKEPSIEGMEKIRKDMRELMKLVDNNRRAPVYTNFEDEFGEAKEIESPKVEEEGELSIDLRRYREKLQHFVEEHKNHLIIEKIRNAKPLTEKDIKTLESLLLEVDPNISKEEFYKVIGEDLKLIEFIRSIAGLSEEVLMDKFGEFLQDQKMSSNQIRFVRQMIKSYTQEGKLEVGALYEEPFNRISQNGIDGVFRDKAKIADLLIERVNELNDLKVG